MGGRRRRAQCRRRCCACVVRVVFREGGRWCCRISQPPLILPYFAACSKHAVQQNAARAEEKHAPAISLSCPCLKRPTLHNSQLLAGRGALKARLERRKRALLLLLRRAPAKAPWCGMSNARARH